MSVGVVAKKGNGGRVTHSPVVARYIAAAKVLKGWTPADIRQAYITYQTIDAQLEGSILMDYRELLSKYKGPERAAIVRRIDAELPSVKQGFKVAGFEGSGVGGTEMGRNNPTFAPCLGSKFVELAGTGLLLWVGWSILR